MPKSKIKGQIIIMLFILLILPIGVFSQYRYMVSIGGNHEKLHDAYGNHVRLYYNFGESIRLNADFTRYYEITEKTETEAFGYDYRSLDLNFNYAIRFGDRFAIYAILGFDYTFGRTASKNDSIVNEKFHESSGMNFGFGTSFRLGHFLPYAEVRNVATSSSYLVFALGLAYSWGKDD